jgi:Fic-DOC domain mobile mystery protein B
MIDFAYPPGATPLTPEEMDGLKLKHISTRGELDRWEQENIQDALAWLKRKRNPNILSEKFTLELHKRMFGKVWVWAGQFRKTDENIGVSWLRIAVELPQLIDDAKTWVEFKTYPADEIAYRFHHRLVWIHLFPYGNGRHSRLMSDIILTELFSAEVFTWGQEDLLRANDIRKQYITALKAADNHDYSLLL